ncbi:MAG TPA: tRNA lysidine(34) synthetase TilS [Methyloceanibacter sp.]|nr:tRNA lysidine(34) synthetase TilS [Methyloceanibacter sp.]
MTALLIAETEARMLLAPLAKFSHVALAVSGGPDSVALLQFAAQWRAAREEGPALTVLTVDHGLRPGSGAEAEQVGRMASALGLSHAILTWKHERLLEASLQERARIARYDLMAAYCHAHSIAALVTAHTLDDQAETFLMRLKRGSGLDGLAAIPERGEWAGIVVLRPLLDVSKVRLIATLDAAGIAFVSDPSNIDPRFERARMRESTDALAALGLTAEAIALSARRLRRARAALEAAARDFLSRHGEMSEAGYVLVDEAALAAAPDEIAIRALARMIEAVGGSGERVRLAKLEALLAALKQEPGKVHTLGRCRIEPVKGRLGIFREVRAGGLPVALVRPGERALWDNRFSIELGSGESEPILVKPLGEEGLRALRESEALPASLPRPAGWALPAVWRDDVLLGLPRLGQTGKAAKCDCSATFIGAGSA